MSALPPIRLLRALPLMMLAGCSGVVESPTFERMIDQPNARPYQSSEWFADGRAMQVPPIGTVPHNRVVGQPELTEGFTVKSATDKGVTVDIVTDKGVTAKIITGNSVDDKTFATKIPVVVDARLLDIGHTRFDIYCSTCHGLRGDGNSEVARNMELRKPPSLVAAPERDFPPGRLFHVATDGYGLMPAFREMLTTEERWAVVAYVRALAISQSVPLDQLPAPLRQTANEALKSQAANEALKTQPANEALK